MQQLSPFRDLGVTTITIRNTGGADHFSFDPVGCRNFSSFQDEVEYGRITHHSKMDDYDHVVPGDLMPVSAVIQPRRDVGAQAIAAAGEDAERSNSRAAPTSFEFKRETCSGRP